MPSPLSFQASIVLLILSTELLKIAIFKLFEDFIFILNKNCWVFKIPSKWLPNEEYICLLLFELHEGLEKLYKTFSESYELTKLEEENLISRIWSNIEYPNIDYQSISYFSAPKNLDDAPKSLDEVDPELIETYNKLGIPLEEQEILAGVAVDAVFDSMSVATTFKDRLAEKGVIFCSISEAV